MKVLFIEKTADGLLDLAIRAQAYGHEAMYFLPTYDQYKAPVGRGLVTRVPNWRDAVNKADLIICGGNDYCVAELDRVRANGKLVVGSCVEAETWESDRAKGMAVFRAAGIPVPPYRSFTDYDTAIAYVKKHDQPFVSKPSGRCDDKAMSYVAKTPADLVYMLQRWKRAGKRIGEEFILQEKLQGIEFAVGAWFGPGGFVTEWEENFEHKKLFPGDLGPNCYSADTEVLTETGWKFWPDVVSSDKIATLVNGYLTFEKPSQLVAAPFRGDMMSWQSNRVDLMVTPGHQMHVTDRNSVRDGEPEFGFKPAHEIVDCKIAKKFAVLRTASWAGNKTMSPEKARLFGMFMADGYVKRRSIQFGNCPAHKETLIRAAALAYGVTCHRYGPDIYINNASLAYEWAWVPTATEKRVPAEIMNAEPQVIAAFLEGFALDASTRANNRIYTTASRGMADDIQVLLLKVGLAGNINERDRRDEPERLLKGYVVKGSLSWDISVSSNALAWLRPRYWRPVWYDGMVYCATVSSHVLFVRRNGKACWNGQTGELGTVSRWVTKSKLADKVLKPLEVFLHRTGFVGCIDVSVIIDEEGTPWPLEFTSRCGWPAFNLECAAFTCDPIEFMHDLAAGKNTKNVHQLDEVVVGVVVALPDFPYSHATRKEVVGVPIYGVTPQLMPHLHFAQVAMGNAPQEAAVNLEDGPLHVAAGDYVVIVSGTGPTVTAARRGAYGHVKQLSMPASPFWRIDVGLRLKKELPKLQSLGYATGLSFT
jgi:phosphoribosylamine-glycine ligase